MSKDLSHVDFFAKAMDEPWPRTMDELVDAWVRYKNDKDQKFSWTFDATDDLCRNEPDLALDFVLEVLKRDLPFEVLALLAAGPMEHALAENGPLLIDRVEIEASKNPKLRHLLGGVWQNAMPNDIWQRILRAVPERW